VADLKERFGEDEHLRLVQAAFLARLLTAGFPQIKIPLQGVRISQAIIASMFTASGWTALLPCDGWYFQA
jgi:hypothetical protein